VSLHAPNWALLAQASPIVKLHLGAAVAALALGSAQMLSRKGARFHRIAGWAWAALMFTVAASSLWIRQIHPGHLWWIHILSGWTLLILPIAVYAARRHNVNTHRRAMSGLFFGGLIIAGVFTFVPGRLMWELFFG